MALPPGTRIRTYEIIPAERNTQLSLSVVLNWEQMLKKKAD